MARVAKLEVKKKILALIKREGEGSSTIGSYFWKQTSRDDEELIKSSSAQLTQHACSVLTFPEGESSFCCLLQISECLVQGWSVGLKGLIKEITSKNDLYITIVGSNRRC